MTRHTATSEDVRAIDVHIARRLGARRRAIGLPIKDFAKAIGVSQQQASKYERGRDRLTAGRLRLAADILRVSVSWLFEGGPAADWNDVPPPDGSPQDAARSYSEIADPKIRQAVLVILHALAWQEAKQD